MLFHHENNFVNNNLKRFCRYRTGITLLRFAVLVPGLPADQCTQRIFYAHSAPGRPAPGPGSARGMSVPAIAAARNARRTGRRRRHYYEEGQA